MYVVVSARENSGAWFQGRFVGVTVAEPDAVADALTDADVVLDGVTVAVVDPDAVVEGDDDALLVVVTVTVGDEVDETVAVDDLTYRVIMKTKQW